MLRKPAVKLPDHGRVGNGIIHRPEGLAAHFRVTPGDHQICRANRQGMRPELLHAACIIVVDVRAWGLEEVFVGSGAGNVLERTDAKVHIGAGLRVDVVSEADSLFDLIKLEALKPVQGLCGWVAPTKLDLTLGA